MVLFRGSAAKSKQKYTNPAQGGKQRGVASRVREFARRVGRRGERDWPEFNGWTGPSQVIGKIQTVIGSGTLTRADGVFFPVKVGDPVCQGDVIETAGDGQITIRFIDDTVFNLSGDAHLELNEFVCDAAGALHSGLFDIARGNFAFKAGQVANAGCLTFETPVASIRGRARSRGIGTLSLTALTFAILDEAKAQGSNGNPFLDGNPLFPGATYSEDGTIDLKDAKFGIVELFLKGGGVTYLDNPGVTVFVPNGSSTPQFIPNTPADQAKLQSFQHDALGTFLAGVAGPTFTNTTSTGSSTPQTTQQTGDSSQSTIHTVAATAATAAATAAAAAAAATTPWIY